MKKFNKSKGLRKIKLQKNKNTYIKKLSISLSCLLLIVCAILLTFAKFENSSDIYTLINGSVDYSSNVCEYEVGKVWNFSYTGSAQTFTVPCSGDYKIELWGAEGNYYHPSADVSSYSGKGGYTAGNIKLRNSNNLYIYVGQHDHTASKYATSMFNSGSVSPTSPTTWYSSGGGGATDVRFFGLGYTPSSSELQWNSSLGLNSRIMVAGAGAGLAIRSNYTASYTYDLDAGGLTSYDAKTHMESGYDGSGCTVAGATQTSGGPNQPATSYGSNNTAGTFGVGGNGPTSGSSPYGSGGGGGYYGGGSGTHIFGTCVGAGSGGSSYISGHTGSVAIAQGSTSEPRAVKKSGCTTGTTDSDCSKHYSNKIFTNTVMIDGKGYNWTSSKGSYVGQTQPDGTTTAGHSGSGYARITLLTIRDRIKINLNTNGGTISDNYIARYINSTLGDIPSPTKADYTFEGWYSDSALTNKVTSETVVTSSMYNLYAKYTDNTAPELSLEKMTYITDNFSGWTLSNSSVSSGVLTMSQNSQISNAKSINYNVNGGFWYPTFDGYTTNTTVMGVHWSSYYYDANMNEATSLDNYTANGWAVSLDAANTWKNNIIWGNYNSINSSYAQLYKRYGPNIKYVNLVFECNPSGTYSRPVTKIRNLKIYGEAIPNSFYDITLTAADPQTGISKKKWASGSRAVSYFASSGTTITSNTFRVTANGTYTVYVENGDGMGTVSTINITNIK